MGSHAKISTSMNALTFPILKLLSDGKFHSGEAIAQQFKGEPCISLECTATCRAARA